MPYIHEFINFCFLHGLVLYLLTENRPSNSSTNCNKTSPIKSHGVRAEIVRKYSGSNRSIRSRSFLLLLFLIVMYEPSHMLLQTAILCLVHS